MSRLVLKSPAEIEIMHRANMILRRTLHDLRERIRPGMTTLEIDEFAERRIRDGGGTPAFKGYPNPGGGQPFPGSACVSVNDEIVHGVPSASVVLKEGDIVSVDMGVLYQGYFGDSAMTFPVGRVAAETEQLLRVTREALDRGVEQHSFSVVREFVGHGIGAQLHEDPQVPNFGQPGRRERLVPGMVLAIEPMVNLGGPEVLLSAEDGWTARTRDGSLSAHFEVCVAVTDNGPQILGEPVDVAGE